MERNTVFISYPSDDVVIAEAVSDAISKLPNNGFEVFLDRIYIKGGARIPDTIRAGLKKTVYFVAIGTNVTRRNFDWCGQELGFYQASHPDDGTRLETCLYDKTIPELFVERKSFKAQSLKAEYLDEFCYPIIGVEKSEFYNFLISIADLNANLRPPLDAAKYWKEVPVWAEHYSIEVTNSFFIALQSRVKDEWYPQGRLELSIIDGEFYKAASASIPRDTQVSVSSSTYRLFKAAAPAALKPLNWTKFTDYVKEKTGSDVLIHIIANIIINALPDKDEAKNDYVFQAPNGNFYRVLLVKHSVYGDKKREFIINFVETLEKVRAGDEDTTALVAGIVLASKYRSIFVEGGAKFDSARLEGLLDDDLIDALTHMLRDIDRISADAASDGLADYSALQTLLGETVQIKALFNRWSEVFPPMEAAAKQFINESTSAHREAFFAAYASFLDVSRKNNTKFLFLCLDEYRKRLLQQSNANSNDDSGGGAVTAKKRSLSKVS